MTELLGVPFLVFGCVVMAGLVVRRTLRDRQRGPVTTIDRGPSCDGVDAEQATATTVADRMAALRVLTVGTDLDAEQPVMLLQQTTPPHRVLPIWVGPDDAWAVFRSGPGPHSAPLGAHALIGDVVDRFGGGIRGVDIVGVDAEVVYAQLVVDNGAIITARPSDAVALALRADAPIRIPQALLQSVGVPADAVLVEPDLAELSVADPDTRDAAAGAVGSAVGGAVDDTDSDEPATVGPTVPHQQAQAADPAADRFPFSHAERDDAVAILRQLTQHTVRRDVGPN